MFLRWLSAPRLKRRAEPAPQRGEQPFLAFLECFAAHGFAAQPCAAQAAAAQDLATHPWAAHPAAAQLFAPHPFAAHPLALHTATGRHCGAAAVETPGRATANPPATANMDFRLGTLMSCLPMHGGRCCPVDRRIGHQSRIRRRHGTGYIGL